jgi:hypothetical protein
MSLAPSNRSMRKEKVNACTRSSSSAKIFEYPYCTRVGELLNTTGVGRTGVDRRAVLTSYFCLLILLGYGTWYQMHLKRVYAAASTRIALESRERERRA